MTKYIRAKVKEYVDTFLKGNPGKTLEIGSYNVNGSVREFFPNHLGVDMRDGPGVDMVLNGQEVSALFPENEFEVVVWLETLEHDDAFWVTRECIDHVLCPGGCLIISVPTIGFPRHDYPSDYWRVTTDGLQVLFGDYEVLDIGELPAKGTSQCVIGIARKRT
jgi:hypothetical protein